MLIDKIKQYKFYIFIFILPFLCFITRKFSKPLYENPLQELNNKSFFGNMNLKNRNILKVEEINKLKDNNNTRLFIKTKDNGAVLYFTFSKYKYYEDYNFSFTINLNLNNSELIANNNSLIYSEACLNYSKGELELWIQMVENKTKMRYVLLHNNLDLNHYIRKENSYLISWDKAKIDIPIFDLYKLFLKLNLSIT